MPRKFLTFAAPLFALLLVLQFGCTIDAVPEDAVNFVGKSHTITATDGVVPQDEFCDLFDCEEEWFGVFLIFAGPDEGEGNLDCSAIFDEECLVALFECLEPGGDPDDCEVSTTECNPSSCAADFGESITWTFQNNGSSGTDYIAVCMAGTPTIMDGIGETAHVLQQENEVDNEDSLTQDEIDAIIEEFESIGCDVVTKTWKDPPQRQQAGAGGGNIGPILAGADAERREREAQAAAAAQQAAGAIRPPNTGDAGLR
jgi:hypothetical protein